jgi:hypothetical protein
MADRSGRVAAGCLWATCLRSARSDGCVLRCRSTWHTGGFASSALRTVSRITQCSAVRSASSASSLLPTSSNLFGRPFSTNMIRRCSPPSSGAGAGWIIVSQIAVMLALAGVAFGDPAHWIAWTVVFSLVLGFAGATPQQMPTYSVTTANVALSQDQKSGIASAITAAHSAHTGPPSYFAQFFSTRLVAEAISLVANLTSRRTCVRPWSD